ncbi:MAG: phosphoribosylaminoimidazolesuccinocarboxamide synthase [candidate division NC10 bacterium]|nr:phosphoribosylaminoimidazolesuccinocarboxamide synthase [candidate division NC10 bacterium]
MGENDVLLETNLPSVPLAKRGKVRDLYDLGEHLLMVATDRISAFDVVLPTGIPGKGKILTQISRYWFNMTRDIVPNHLLSTDIKDFPEVLQPSREILAGRSMLVKKARPLPVECIVRGYLSGSAWKEYRAGGSVCGIILPPGLLESARLEEPIFTPSTKAEGGAHDENIPFERTVALLGRNLAEQVKVLSLALYRRAREMAERKGIIVADTKFEFGIEEGTDRLLLIDELLTPDSSRFWPKDDYEPGRPQQSFDKQFVRDYLEQVGWDKRPPAPPLPDEIVQKTAERYAEALARLTGA